MSKPADNVLLVAEKASKLFGAKLIFKNVSCRIPAGSVTLLVGPNGAGKTTLLKVMAGLAAPSAGMVEAQVPREKVGFLAHATYLYPQLSAAENLAFWSDVYGLGLSEAERVEMLDNVGLKAAAFEQAGTFSRGMAQRLSLARLLMIRPQLLFLDEPGTGLDAGSRGMLTAEIEAAKDRGAAVIWVTHDVKADLDRSDFVLTLEDRRRPAFLLASQYEPSTPLGVC